VSTAPLSHLTATSVDCGGEVSAEGGSAVTGKGLVWGDTPEPTVGSHLGITDHGGGLGAFGDTVGGLTLGQG
jgi:hypothetical protein